MARLLSLLFALMALLLAPPAMARERGPVVLAAASLQESLSEAANAWAAKGYPKPVLSFAASSALARQVIAGAPADLFLSADEPWMDAAAKAGMASLLVMAAPFCLAEHNAPIRRGFQV